jgi:hypothetical protein
MEPKPVSQDRTPEYPTRRQLYKSGAAVLLFGSVVGCKGGPGYLTQGEVGPPTPDKSVVESMLNSESEPNAQELVNLPPTEEPNTFPDLDYNRAISACIVIMPPVFMSEEEVEQIQNEDS